jgi:hypothetical protein
MQRRVGGFAALEFPVIIPLRTFAGEPNAGKNGAQLKTKISHETNHGNPHHRNPIVFRCAWFKLGRRVKMTNQFLPKS